MKIRKLIPHLVFALTPIASSVALANTCPNVNSEDITAFSEKFDELKGKFKEVAAQEKLPSEPIGSDLAELENASPGFAEVAGSLAEVGGTLLGVEMGLGGLAAGIRDHNNEEIITSSVTIGTSVGIPILTRIITELAGEMVGEVFGGVAAGVVAEGFSIYSGVKAEQAITKVKDQNADLKSEFVKYADQVINKMNNVRGTILGNSGAALKLDAKLIPDVLFNVNKEKMDYLSDKIFVEMLSAKAYYLNQQRITPDTEGGSDNVDTVLSYIDHQSYMINEEFRYITIKPTPGIYPAHALKISNKYKKQGRSWTTEEVVFESKIFKQYLEPLLVYRKNIANPVAEHIVEQVMDNNKALIKEYKALIQSEMSSDVWQQQLTNQYNTAIRTQLAWYIFGQELIAQTDTADFDVAESLLWISRIFFPMIDGFYDGSLTKKAIKDIDMGPITVALVNKFTSDRLDINDEEKVNQIIINQLHNDEDVPPNIQHAVHTALQNTHSRVNKMLLADSDIVKLSFDKKQVLEQIQQLEKNHVFTNSINKKIEDYLDNFGGILNPRKGTDETFNRDAVMEMFGNVLVDAAELHQGYMWKIKAQLSDLHGTLKSHPDVCSASQALYQSAEYIELNYYDYYVQNPSFSHYKWLTFRMLPDVVQETNQIINYLGNSANLLADKGQCFNKA
ncbi:hypothetical protein [Pseudoalteromonas sp. MMG005]|uniref:hypothetical protein n=1 Tax=Pseudoalteromonas sp. MMG005 TaxID=2822682 RepID=UPI001B39E3A7|nr:hypothetical protein [Pseudoalteromonas sp. MMG005]MBQ4848253.1 hypothetical protein [Pseudoalteromonas sp. MMG005]